MRVKQKGIPMMTEKDQFNICRSRKSADHFSRGNQETDWEKEDRKWCKSPPVKGPRRKELFANRIRHIRFHSGHDKLFKGSRWSAKWRLWGSLLKNLLQLKRHAMKTSSLLHVKFVRRAIIRIFPIPYRNLNRPIRPLCAMLNTSRIFWMESTSCLWHIDNCLYYFNTITCFCVWKSYIYTYFLQISLLKWCFIFLYACRLLAASVARQIETKQRVCIVHHVNHNEVRWFPHQLYV